MLRQLNNLVAPVEALLSSLTKPSPGVCKVTTDQLVVIAPYSDDRTVYELMVKTRLILSGRNPDDFVISQATWGQRQVGSPLVVHKGQTYLQCIVLDEGTVSYTYFGKPIAKEALESVSRNHQGLPPDLEVRVRTYKVDSITALQLL